MKIIPQTLLDQITRGEVTLFLGAGASFGSLDENKNKILLGNELRDSLCDEFLSGNEKNRDLKTIANFVENEFGLLKLNEYIAKKFSDYSPNKGISLFPSFRWKSIYSTNYDLLVEKAYEQTSAYQTLIPFYKDVTTIDNDLAKCENPLPLFKLHGTINAIHDRSAPLVITSSSYVDVKSFRVGLFDRLINDVHKQTVVFIGTQLADPHIEGILLDLEKQYGKERPMHYLVSPSLTSYDESYFSARRIKCIALGVDEFMQKIDGAIEVKDRDLFRVIGPLNHPIQNHFLNNNSVPRNLQEFITNKIEYVHRGISSVEVSPKLFFEGMSESWTPIQNQYDIIRDGYESLVLNVLMQSENKDPSVDIISIVGVAGSGKTTLLRRLAYDLSVKHGELVLYAAPDTALRTSPFLELYDNTSKRIILLVDNAADQIIDLEKICSDLNRQNVPITIIIADTKASFGDRLECLDEYIRQTRKFKELSEIEIELLLKKLNETNALGQLKSLSQEERVSTFKNLARKQLLVALYEATQGRPLEELLVEEYHRILLSEAQELYLLVATLHRFNIPVRAGLVSRTMGIKFEDFEKKFLGPLEGLVYAKMDYKSRDYVYKTRHPHVAEILFRRILDTQSLQAQQYARILSNLNPTYSSDDQALKNMISSTSLKELTTNLDERRFLLSVADKAMPNNTFIIQQQAILEMNSRNGDLDVAEYLLEKAMELSPHDVSLKHTNATLLARKADAAEEPLRSKTLRAKSRSLLKALRGKSYNDAYVEISLGKLAVKDIEHIIKSNGNLENPIIKKELLRLIEEAEREFGQVEKSNIHGSAVVTERAKLRRLLKENNKSISIIENALKSTPDSRRLAVAYNDAVKSEDLLKGRAALTQALLSHPNDKRLNEALFYSLIEESDNFSDAMGIPLRKGFTLESDNISMHLHALRYYFIRGEYKEYEKILLATKKLQQRLRVSNKPQLPVPPKYANSDNWIGEVVTIKPYFAFIKCSSFDQNIFCSSRFVDPDFWDSLVSGEQVKFDLEFNLRGAIATNLSK